MHDRYQYYKHAFRGRTMPFAFVDLDLFDENVKAIATRANGKPVRIASKSIRCVALMHRILEDSSRFRGVMAYSVREAVLLTTQGFDDILVAYPAYGEIENGGVCEALRAGKRVVLTVDCMQHVQMLEQLGAGTDVKIPVCLDVDMALVYPGIHFGVRRSPIRTPDQALVLARRIKECRHVYLDGVMGYEAQVAGLQDAGPYGVFKNWLIAFLKRKSIREVGQRRGAVVAALRADGFDLRFVNGGGTGSVETTCADAAVTEVTAGSGFFSPALFDHYRQFKHAPAAGYAIEIVRCPGPGVFTCLGGGYIASGAAGPDRLPQPYLPEGAELIGQEGAGEVQTPIRYAGPEPLRIGDPVFMRHAKAGELCERFNSLLLVSRGEVVDETPTYRGQGWCFF